MKTESTTSNSAFREYIAPPPIAPELYSKELLSTSSLSDEPSVPPSRLIAPPLAYRELLPKKVESETAALPYTEIAPPRE